jgi:hypothetical protein
MGGVMVTFGCERWWWLVKGWEFRDRCGEAREGRHHPMQKGVILEKETFY